MNLHATSATGLQRSVKDRCSVLPNENGGGAGVRLRKPRARSCNIRPKGRALYRAKSYAGRHSADAKLIQIKIDMRLQRDILKMIDTSATMTRIELHILKQVRSGCA
jgi:hypothetical protein